METDDLPPQLTEHMRKLRQCDTQATAVEWMRDAYLLMEKCLEALKEREAKPSGLIFIPAQKVYCRPNSVLLNSEYSPPVWLRGQTVVYPPVPLPIPKPKAVPWTRRDTLKLERAVIQRRGK